MSEDLQESVDEGQIDEVQVQPEQEQPQQDMETRPDWLPEKFKTEQDFATSYANLEKRLHEQKKLLVMYRQVQPTINWL